MELKDVIKGNYYYSEYQNNISSPNIILAMEDGSFDNCPGVSNKDYYYSISNPWASNKNIRTATPQEIHHLKVCMKLNKFIPYDEALLLLTATIKIEPNLELEKILKNILYENRN